MYVLFAAFPIPNCDAYLRVNLPNPTKHMVLKHDLYFTIVRKGHSQQILYQYNPGCDKIVALIHGLFKIFICLIELYLTENCIRPST